MWRNVWARLAIAGGLVGATVLLVAARAPVRWVSTFAGGSAGLMDGPAADARFFGPAGLALDDRDPARPVLYVADVYNHRIRKVELGLPGGPRTTTIAGSGGLGHSGGGLREGLGAQAAFHFPRDLALDGKGGLYVVDTNNHRIRRIDLGAPGYPVTTVAGTTRGSADGPGDAARFNAPWGLAHDGVDGLIVADTYNNRIRRVDLGDPRHPVTTLAGGDKGYADGPVASALFDAPVGVTVDRRRGAGMVYVADASNRCIRRFVPGQAVTTLGGAPRHASDEALYVEIPLIYPTHVTFGPDGLLYASDQATCTIYRVGTEDGALTALAGIPGRPPGNVDGSVAWARFGQPAGLVATTTFGVFVADATYHSIRLLR